MPYYDANGSPSESRKSSFGILEKLRDEECANVVGAISRYHIKIIDIINTTSRYD